MQEMTGKMMKMMKMNWNRILFAQPLSIPLTKIPTVFSTNYTLCNGIDNSLAGNADLLYCKKLILSMEWFMYHNTLVETLDSLHNRTLKLPRHRLTPLSTPWQTINNTLIFSMKQKL